MSGGEKMDQSIPEVTEIKIGTITFRVAAHFEENGLQSIDTKLVKLMKKEMENRMTKPESS